MADRIEEFFEMISDRVTTSVRAASKAATQMLEYIIPYLEQWKHISLRPEIWRLIRHLEYILIKFRN